MDFTLQDLWWLKPKGPDNPMPALQLGAQIAQNKAAMDLREADLINEFARTSLARQEALAKQQIRNSISAGNAAIATAAAKITDWSDLNQLRGIYEVGARYPMVVGGNAWKGAELMHKNAVTAKEKAQADKGIAESVTLGFDESGNPITENFIRFGNRVFRSTQHEIVEDPKTKKRFIKSGSGALHALDSDAADVSTDPNTGQQFIQALPILDASGKQVGTGYRGSKGNIIRLPDQKLSQGEDVSYKNELKALNEKEEAELKATPSEGARIRNLYNLKRRELTAKFFGSQKNPRPSEIAPPGAQLNPPSTVDPASKIRVISPNGTPGFIPASQLDEALKSGYTQP